MLRRALLMHNTRPYPPTRRGRRTGEASSCEPSRFCPKSLSNQFSTKRAADGDGPSAAQTSTSGPFSLEALLAKRTDIARSTLPCKVRDLRFPPKPNARVSRILAVLLQHEDWYVDTQKLLDALNVKLNHKVVRAVLKSLSHAKVAVGFFKWAGMQPHFQHTTTTYAAIVRLVGDSGDFNLMYTILLEMKKDECPLTPYFLADIIMAYGNSNMAREAFLVFEEMRDAGCPPNLFVYNCLISVLTKCGYLEGAKQVHEAMWNFQHCQPDTVTYNMLIDKYGKSGDVLEAQRYLQHMNQKNIQPNEKSYASVIGNLNRAGKPEKALEIFQAIKDKRFLVNKVTYTELIKGLGKAGKVVDALSLYHEMEGAGYVLEVVTYNIIIDILVRHGLVAEAWKIFVSMEGKQCSPNEVTYNSMIKGFCKAQRMDEALQWYETMKQQGIQPGDYTYATLVGGFCNVGEWKAAYEFLMETEKLCAQSLITGGVVHTAIDKSRFTRSVFVHNIMLDAFVKAGQIESACAHFKSMKERGCCPDVVSCTTIIHGLGNAGKTNDVMAMYKEMKVLGIQPNLVTFNTLIYIFAKAGMTFEVQQIVDEMVCLGLKPDSITYISLLPTVKTNRRVLGKDELAAVKRRFDQILQKVQIDE